MDATPMIWYGIDLLQLGFHPVAVVGKLVKKIGKGQVYTKRETMHKTIQKHKIHKIENKHKTRKQAYKEYLKTLVE